MTKYNDVMDVEEDQQRATQLVASNRQAGIDDLNRLFRHGRIPDPQPSGRHNGKLLALSLAPGLTQLVDAITSAWTPWKGKVFYPANQSGDNVFTRDSFGLVHVFWPLYRGYQQDGPETYRAFVFRTSIAAGSVDTDRQVLKLDYDLPRNPGFSIRRVLDEVVKIADGTYLGKAHLKWWCGRWQTVDFFFLTKSA